MKLTLKALPLAVSLSVCSVTSMASTQFGEYVTLSGFGTLGATRTNTDQASFGRDGQTTGATTDPSVQVDSNLGLQLSVKPTKWLTGTVQALSMQRTQTFVTTELEWAFVKVEPFAGAAIRVGRTPPPLFAVSDSRNVGYANTWLRPPNEVYALSVLKRMEGVDASYRFNVGETTFTLSGQGGKSELIPSRNSKVDVTDLRGLNVVWDTPWGIFRVGRASGIVQLSGAGATAGGGSGGGGGVGSGGTGGPGAGGGTGSGGTGGPGAGGAPSPGGTGGPGAGGSAGSGGAGGSGASGGAGAAATASPRVSTPSTDRYTFSGVGYILDRDNLVLQAEHVWRRSEGSPSRVSSNGWYILTGWRLNTYTPYVSYGRTSGPNVNSPLRLSGKQSTLAAGLRWDFNKSMALKAQLERINVYNTMGVSFSERKPEFGSAPITAASVAVDFVF